MTVDIPTNWLTVLEALRGRNVQFLISGSAADAIVEGNPDTASALVVSPSPFRRNLERLAKALSDLGATDTERVVNHPAARWQYDVAGARLDVIGSAVGDGEFSIRVWRTRPVTLVADESSLQCEVEFASEFSQVGSAS